eukprot:scaffold107_cov106-Isochrysis_galbana.AAC.23
MDTLPQERARRDGVVETHTRTSLALEMRVTGTKWRVVAVALVHPPTLLWRAVTAARAERAGGDEVLSVRRKLGREFWLTQRPGNVGEPIEKATLLTGSKAAGVKRRRKPGHALVVDELAALSASIEKPLCFGE